jgi:glycosyltransferase involved in cell wall biosynthesis
MSSHRAWTTDWGDVVRILMLGWELPPHFAGGVGIVAAALARATAAAGVDVTYLMPSGPDEGGQDGFRLLVASQHGPPLRVGRLESRLQPYDGTRLTAEPWAAPHSMVGGPAERPRLYGPELLAEVRWFAERAVDLVESAGLTVDAVHSHDWTTWPAGVALKRALGVPLVVHVHITEFDKSGGGGVDPLVYAIEREGMQAADRVIAVSHRVARSCVERYGVDPARIRVVYNALDPLGSGRARPRVGPKTVLFLGRVTLQKGPDYFIEAARRVLAINPDVRFVLAGAGDMWAPLIERAATLGIGDRVLFTGFVSREEVRELMARADLFVMPSVSEPFGLVALEAMEAGVPVILSRQSGVGEMVHHVLKADFWDADDLAAKILAVLAYPALASVMGRSGQVESRQRTWADVAREVIQVHHEARGDVREWDMQGAAPC